MDALAAGHDAAVQMIDTSIIRVHQHGACIADNNYQDMGRSRGGQTSKIHAVVDTNGLPAHLALTPGEAHDNRLCSVLLCALLPQTMLLADRGYDADWIRELARQQGAWANIPPKRNRKDPICFSPYLYRARNLVERFFNKIKQCRRIATRYDKPAADYLAFIKRQHPHLATFLSVHALVLCADKSAQPRLLGLAPGRHADSFLVEVRRPCRQGDFRHQVFIPGFAHLAAGVHVGDGLAHLLGGSIRQLHLLRLLNQILIGDIRAGALHLGGERLQDHGHIRQAGLGMRRRRNGNQSCNQQTIAHRGLPIWTKN